jgi:penicillin-binding protein 1A
VTSGTATRAQIADTFIAGKTGTTENYGDAWFVGWTEKITVAVWVGYPDELRPMETEFNGEAVAGGTYPAAIWKSFVESALNLKEYAPKEEEEPDIPVAPDPAAPETPGTTVPETPAPEPDDSPPTGDGGTEPAPVPEETAPVEPAPEDVPPAEQPPPAAEEPPSTGGGTGAPE